MNSLVFEEVLQKIKQIIAELSERDVANIEANLSIGDFGFGSVHLTQLKIRLDTLAGTELNNDDFLELPSISFLAENITERLEKQDKPIKEMSAEFKRHIPEVYSEDKRYSLIRFVTMPQDFFLDVIKNHGEIAKFKTKFTENNFVISDPVLIEHLLKREQDNLVKGEVIESLREFVGKGLLTNDDKEWQVLKIVTQAYFTKNNIINREKILTDATKKYVEKFSCQIKKRPINTLNFFQEYTLKLFLALADIVLSEKQLANLNTLLNAFAVRSRGYLTADIRKENRNTDRTSFLKNSGFFLLQNKLNQAVDEIVEENKNRHSGLIASLLSSCEKEGVSNQVIFIRESMLSLLFAAFDTTATNLLWTMYLLEKNNVIKQKLKSELEKLHGFPEINSLEIPYLKQIIYEALRLYPPVWLIARVVKNEIRYNDYIFPKDSIIFICPFAIHRNPWYWNDPLTFDPDRFKGKDSHFTIPGFLPFSLGYRSCIGSHFALFEAAIMIRELLKDENFALYKPDEIVTLTSQITLAPKLPILSTISSLIYQEPKVDAGILFFDALFPDSVDQSLLEKMAVLKDRSQVNYVTLQKSINDSMIFDANYIDYPDELNIYCENSTQIDNPFILMQSIIKNTRILMPWVIDIILQYKPQTIYFHSFAWWGYLAAQYLRLPSIRIEANRIFSKQTLEANGYGSEALLQSTTASEIFSDWIALEAEYGIFIENPLEVLFSHA